MGGGDGEMGPIMRGVSTVLLGAMMVVTGGFALAASTNDEVLANAALRELHDLAVASAQSERAAKDSDDVGC